MSQENVFRVFNQVRLKPACSASETRHGLEISAIGSWGIIQATNNRGAYQTAQMRRLIFHFVGRIMALTYFLMMWLVSSIAGLSLELSDKEKFSDIQGQVLAIILAFPICSIYIHVNPSWWTWGRFGFHFREIEVCIRVTIQRPFLRVVSSFFQ